jgi:CubicO group peptidase (beta-lactamase class C family)
MKYIAIALALISAPALAQTAPPATEIAANADVQAATRLFSAWLEGQMAYRGLPGVAVGVVQDQQLIWSHGFGFADVATKKPMTADTRFRIASNADLAWSYQFGVTLDPTHNPMRKGSSPQGLSGPPAC